MSAAEAHQGDDEDTLRREADRFLRESEERFHLVANTAPVMIWISGVDKLCNYFNQRWLQFTGKSLESELGNGWAEGVHPEDLEQCLETYTKAFDRREPYQMQYRLRHHDGEYRWILVSGVPRYGADSAFAGYIGSAVDITELKLAEEVRFRHAAIVESLDDAIISKNLQGVIQSWNRGAQRLFGYTEAEIVGRPITVIVPDELRDAETEILRRVGNGERIEHYETVRFTKEGKQVDVSVTLFPIRDDSGKTISACSIARDITERKQVEKSVLWRLEFESLLSDLSTTFIGLPEEEIGSNIEWGLARLGEFLEMDRIALFEFSRDHTELTATYSWNAPGVRKAPDSMTANDVPWWWDRTLRGEVSLASQLDDLPEEASAEKEYLHQRGIVSVASIPLKVAGQINGAITFVTVQRQVSWTEDLVNQLRAIGEIFWNALKRKHATEALLAAQAMVRESEERFRLAAQAGRMYAFDWNVVTDVIVRSEESAHILGLIGEPVNLTKNELLARVHPEDRARFINSIVETTPENPNTQISYRLLRADGSVLWVERIGHAFFDEEGRKVRMIGMVADITERKLAEEALSTVSHKLIEAHEEERTRIARELHDDINQRLALLAVNLEQLKRDLPPREAVFRQRLANECTCVSELASDIQALSHRLYSSKLEYLGLEAAAKSFCAELAGLEQVEIDFHSENISKELSQEISLSLFRVLQEALQNAIKHSGSRQFQVSLSNGTNEIELTVHDSGVGFEPEEAVKGRGLGLTSMRERLKLLNGHLVIDSKLRGGTTIHARVPLNPTAKSVGAGIS